MILIDRNSIRETDRNDSNRTNLGKLHSRKIFGPKDPALNTLRSAPGGYCFRNIFCILNRAYMKKNDNGAVKTLMFYIFWPEKDNM